MTAASVRTRVVSWKDAAARKELVESEAFVTPRSTVCAVAGSPPAAMVRALISSNSKRSKSSIGRSSVSPAQLAEGGHPSRNTAKVSGAALQRVRRVGSPPVYRDRSSIHPREANLRHQSAVARGTPHQRQPREPSSEARVSH